MAFKRKRRFRGGSRRKRRFIRRKRFARRRFRKTGNRIKVVHFKRYAELIGPSPRQIVGNSAFAPYINSFQFRFADIQNHTEFSALFDQYRLNMIIVRFYLKIDPSAQVSGAATFPKLYYRADYDDANTPSGLPELRESNRTVIKVMNPNYPVTIKIKPAVASALFQSLATTAYSAKWKQWVDILNSSVPHYGLKYAIDDLTNSNYRVDIEHIYYFSMRDQR